MCLGVIEIANKKRGAEFTKLDKELILEISKDLSQGFLNEEISHNLK